MMGERSSTYACSVYPTFSSAFLPTYHALPRFGRARNTVAVSSFQFAGRARRGSQGRRFFVVFANAGVHPYLLDAREQHIDPQASHRQQPGRSHVFCHPGELRLRDKGARCSRQLSAEFRFDMGMPAQIRCYRSIMMGFWSCTVAEGWHHHLYVSFISLYICH